MFVSVWVWGIINEKKDNNNDEDFLLVYYVLFYWCVDFCCFGWCVGGGEWCGVIGVVCLG